MSDTTYPPSADMAARAHADAATYEEMYAASIADPEGFWGTHGQRIDWIKPFSKVKNTSFAPGNIDIKWFEDGTLNVAANCIDRHLETRGDQTAIIFEPDDPEEAAQHITYKALHASVCKMANVLTDLGVAKGDRVVIYLPMIPEAAYAMLACARIGAIHSIVFAGFSPDALSARINGCDAKVVITADEAPRLKPFAALAEKLGLFAGQISDYGFEEVVIEYEGEVAELNRKPLTAAALAGLLRASRGDVNMVSAPAILQDTGVKLAETKTEDSPVYDSLIRIKVLTKRTENDPEPGWRSLAGTLIAGQPRIVEVKGMALEGDFSPTVLYVNNLDKPGFIGSLGVLLGKEEINIATFHLGRTDAGGEAIALIGIDSEPSNDLVKQLKSLPHVRYANVLNF